MQTRRLADGRAVVAPDGSRIRELAIVARGSMVHSARPELYLSTRIRCASLSPT